MSRCVIIIPSLSNVFNQSTTSFQFIYGFPQAICISIIRQWTPVLTAHNPLRTTPLAATGAAVLVLLTSRQRCQGQDLAAVLRTPRQGCQGQDLAAAAAAEGGTQAADQDHHTGPPIGRDRAHGHTHDLALASPTSSATHRADQDDPTPRVLRERAHGRAHDLAPRIPPSPAQTSLPTLEKHT